MKTVFISQQRYKGGPPPMNDYLSYLHAQNEFDLMHFGIKRRSGRYPWGSGKRPFQAETNTTFVGQDRNEDIRIKKGTEVYRVQNLQNLSDQPFNKNTFISILGDDHLDYLSAAAGEEAGVASVYLENNGNDGRPYSITMKVDTELIAPSYEKSFQAFIDTIADVGLDTVAKESIPNYKYRKDLYKTWKKDVKNMNLEDAREWAYREFMSSFMKDGESRRKFVEILEKQGYNAIIDDWDVGFGKDGEGTKSAMIVFDKTSLKQTKSIPLTEDDIEYFSEKFWNMERSYNDVPKKWKKFRDGR